MEKPFRHRHDGWTPERQTAFLKALRETGNVRAACAHVGLSNTSAYRAKDRIPAFDDAWELTLSFTTQNLERVAFDRAVNGWTEPIVRGGKVVAEKRRYSNQLLGMLLKCQDARRDSEAVRRKELWELVIRTREEYGSLTPSPSQDDVDRALSRALKEFKARKGEPLTPPPGVDAEFVARSRAESSDEGNDDDWDEDDEDGDDAC